MIEKNTAYVSRNGGDALDEHVVKTMVENSHIIPSTFFDNVMKMMVCSAIFFMSFLDL
jgi:hypothetical protein